MREAAAARAVDVKRAGNSDSLRMEITLLFVLKHMETICFMVSYGYQQKARGLFQEQIQAIVMHPMSGAGHLAPGDDS